MIREIPVKTDSRGSALGGLPARSVFLLFMRGLGGALVMALAFVQSAAADEPAFNRRATATAQILAGIAPVSSDPAIDRLVKLEAFAEHQKWMMAQWSQVKGRLGAMENSA